MRRGWLVLGLLVAAACGKSGDADLDGGTEPCLEESALEVAPDPLCSLDAGVSAKPYWSCAKISGDGFTCVTSPGCNGPTCYACNETHCLDTNGCVVPVSWQCTCPPRDAGCL